MVVVSTNKKELQMKITIKLSREELNEIIDESSNYCNDANDVRINVIDAIDSVLSLPGYDVKIEVE